MQWDSSYTVRWKVVKVDKDSWGDLEEIPNINSISITKDATDDVPLLETCSLSIFSDVDDAFENGWYRVIAYTYQDGAYERYPLMTFMVETTGGVVDYGRLETSLSGYSVLKTAADMKFPQGEYIPKGMNLLDYIFNLFRASIIAPFTIEGDRKELNEYYVFDGGITYLDAIWQCLDIIGYVMQITGDGRIEVKPKPEEISLYLDRANAKLLSSNVSFTQDISSIPNRYYVVDDTKVEVIVNNQADSIVSVANRGRYVDEYDSAPTLINGESLYMYGVRMLKEKSLITKDYSYTREFNPDVRPFDRVQGSISTVGLEGELVVKTQTFTCDKGISVAETSGYVIEGYTG